MLGNVVPTVKRECAHPQRKAAAKDQLPRDNLQRTTVEVVNYKNSTIHVFYIIEIYRYKLHLNVILYFNIAYMASYSYCQCSFVLYENEYVRKFGQSNDNNSSTVHWLNDKKGSGCCCVNSPNSLRFLKVCTAYSLCARYAAI